MVIGQYCFMLSAQVTRVSYLASAGGEHGELPTSASAPWPQQQVSPSALL